MPGSSPREPVGYFVGQIQKALSCVTDAHVVRSHDSCVPGDVRSLKAPKDGYTPLRGEQKLHLSVALEYEVIEDPSRARHERFYVQTVQYRYHVVANDMSEIIAFHWLPNGQCSIDRPHLHVGSNQLTPTAVLSVKHHIPSGRLALESVIELLISEMRVVPLRDDWQQLLQEGREAFRRLRSWS